MFKLASGLGGAVVSGWRHSTGLSFELVSAAGSHASCEAPTLCCQPECPNALFGAARFTAQCVGPVGQDVSPGKCVFSSSSKAVRRVMKHWDVSGDERRRGRSNWLSEILVVILISPEGLCSCDWCLAS